MIEDVVEDSKRKMRKVFFSFGVVEDASEVCSTCLSIVDEMVGRVFERMSKAFDGDFEALRPLMFMKP